MDPAGVEVHWLFRAGAAEPECLGIQVFPNGDYVVIDSPTGTYMAGHADKGHWRRECDRYIGLGYVSEAQAKAAGLIPQAWSREPPPPPWVVKRNRRQMFVIAIAFIAAMALAALLFQAIVRLVMSAAR